MTSQVTKWRPWEPGDPVNVFCFGLYKTGKTFGAGSFPRLAVLDFDHGLSTWNNPEFMRTHGIVVPIEARQFYDPRGKYGVASGYNAIDEACRFIDEMMAPDRIDSFDTWLLDSATTLIEASTNKAIILLGSKEFKGSKSETYAQAQQYGLVVPKIQDYGAERSMTEQVIQQLLDTGKNVVVLAHEMERLDESGSVTAIVPALTGKSVNRIPLKFDEVYNLRVKAKGLDIKTGRPQYERYVQTIPDGLRAVGSRNGVPDGTAWTYKAISQALEANWKERQRLIKEAQNASSTA